MVDRKNDGAFFADKFFYLCTVFRKSSARCKDQYAATGTKRAKFRDRRGIVDAAL